VGTMPATAITAMMSAYSTSPWPVSSCMKLRRSTSPPLSLVYRFFLRLDHRAIPGNQYVSDAAMAADDPGNRISDIEGEQEVLPRRERGPGSPHVFANRSTS